MVEDNHNLIYWYINMKHLDVDEWYDLFAIELCKTIISFDETKGSLSNYYKIRCDNLFHKECNKLKLQKNSNNGIYQISDIKHLQSQETVEEQVMLEEFMSDSSEILQLRIMGYTQTEIADKLGLTQSYISKILAKKRADYVDR